MSYVNNVGSNSAMEYKQVNNRVLPVVPKIPVMPT